MKKIFTIIALLFSLYGFAQDKKWYKPFITGRDVALYSCQFVAGASEAYNTTLATHYAAFQRRHPGANPELWDPRISFKRKYKDFDGGDYRAAYFGSKTFLVCTTDPYHATSMVTHAANFASMAIICFGDLKTYPKKQRPLVVIKQLAISFLVNRIAFETVFKYYQNY